MRHSIARRQFLRQALSAAVLAGSGLYPALVEAMGKVPALPAGRSIYQLKGRVRVNQQAAKLATPIKANALIETGDNSQVIFVVGKDAHLLRENSQLQLEGDNLLETGLRLLTGKLLSVFGARAAGEEYQAQTGLVTIGIRGTGLYLEAEPDRTYACTCYGKVELVATADPSQREAITSHHHDAPRYISKNGKITPAPVKDHKDSELILIEALVGRKPPFLNDPFYSPLDSY